MPPFPHAFLYAPRTRPPSPHPRCCGIYRQGCAHHPARLFFHSTPRLADTDRIIINRKENTATATAGLIIPAVGHNKLRHETLQNFMLSNDSSTIAIEIPIWLTEDEIAELETKYGIKLAAGGAPRSITGHIDFLQVRTTPSITILITTS